MDNYERKRLIGRGSYGEAWTVRSKIDKKKYILKIISAINISQSDRNRGQLEIDALKKLVHHDNVVKYVDDFYESEKQQFSIIMEYCKNGDLAKAFANKIKTGDAFGAERGITFSIHKIHFLFLHEHFFALLNQYF